MNKPVWIVVANASLARCFEQAAAPQPLLPLASLEHPESRMHGRDLQTDRPGQTHKDDAGRTSFVPRTEPKERERTEFARRVAKFLEDGGADNRYKSVLLFASNPFLGELLAHLSPGVRQHVTASHALDLTALDPAALTVRVRQALLP